MEERSLKEQAGLNAESMLPPLSTGARRAYATATAISLLLALLPFTPLM